MIDTDKYENHDMIRIAKQLLIEDAPLLLEEVKRLRKALKDAEDVIRYALEMSSDDDSTRVFEDYLELIE